MKLKVIHKVSEWIRERFRSIKETVSPYLEDIKAWWKETAPAFLGWLKASNHWKHLVGGFVVGFIPARPEAAIYGGIVAASCLELKDKLYGNTWDWQDWLLTFMGAAAGCSARQLFMSI